MFTTNILDFICMTYGLTRWKFIDGIKPQRPVFESNFRTVLVATPRTIPPTASKTLPLSCKTHVAQCIGGFITVLKFVQWQSSEVQVCHWFIVASNHSGVEMSGLWFISSIPYNNTLQYNKFLDIKSRCLNPTNLSKWFSMFQSKRTNTIKFSTLIVFNTDYTLVSI